MKDRETVKQGGAIIGGAVMFLLAGGVGLNWWFIVLAGLVGAIVGGTAAAKGWDIEQERVVSRQEFEQRERRGFH